LVCFENTTGFIFSTPHGTEIITEGDTESSIKLGAMADDAELHSSQCTAEKRLPLVLILLGAIVFKRFGVI
jgi:hypothetical protein